MTAGAVSAPLIIPIIPLQTHRAKNQIHTSTPVSIHSDTLGVTIFYTLDGSKPAVAQQGPAGSSRKYSEPILLPAGRVCVRAVAVSSDGRQSSAVTKVFSVELANSNNRKEKEESFVQSEQQRPTEGTSCSPENSAGSSLRPPEPRMMGNGSPLAGPRFLNSRLGSPSTTKAHTGSSQRSQSVSSGALKQLNSTQMSRIQRETDFLRCAQCLSFRPSDPFARFCAQCGAVVPPLPEQRLPPAEGGQMVLCVFCNNMVPVNTHTCLICEASVQQQIKPQARLTLQDHVVCVCCGSGNPAHTSICLTCESRLQPEVCVGTIASSVPADSRMLSCSRCKRINHCDARYCDWCGSKPGHAASCVMCWRCGASGHPYAFYCATCGVYLEAPAPPTSCSDITQPIRVTAPNQVTTSSDPTSTLKLAPPTVVDQYTQTVGLYYPSTTKINREDQQRALQLSRQQATRDRHPLLTAISPGRGYWRKQLDHVCAHLRSYAQNNAPFRALLGEPRLGQMVSAVIQEDCYEVSLTVSFVSAGQKKKQVDPEGDGAGAAAAGNSAAGGVLPAGGTEALSSVTERFPDSSSLRKNGLMKPPKPNLMPKPQLQVKDIPLLKELCPSRGQISVIQQLLDQGADPSCCGSDGRHALAVAVMNGHCDVLPVLVQHGADVDQQSGPMKNTALHEAASLGSEGLQCAKVLLSCRAGVRRRNAAGQTPFDVAVSSGCDDMVSLLAARSGLDLLGKLGKPKLNLDVF
ncbi:double zinc ribbon and ankyrin repeat-containing protein 1 isoform X2 [Toxotes jaculatrix]|uniref:double zinc ribbon and ankyrin repeat-containing protein 1 isoform X2 n=1 Tax=Toxotes jaculatrix TaxID=941984 RepID=UPI001B3AF755|nr:double zinc ribbon and ankyrin repeat-containing protein 1 isoform X2 [Toxotes jaculatrix]